MVLVLDTNTLVDPTFLRWLRDRDEEILLPAVAYLEVCYQALKRKRSLEELGAALAAARIQVVPFDAAQAEAAALAVIGRWDFADNARDYAIGALAQVRGATMVTENKKHFSWLPEVRTPRNLMK